jgi:hypothetical protein
MGFTRRDPSLMEKEPAQIAGGSASVLVAAIIGLLKLYGVHIADGTGEFVVTILAISAPYITALAIRTQVWSPASKQKAVDQAHIQGRLSGIAQEVNKQAAGIRAVDYVGPTQFRPTPTPPPGYR